MRLRKAKTGWNNSIHSTRLFELVKSQITLLHAINKRVGTKLLVSRSIIAYQSRADDISGFLILLSEKKFDIDVIENLVFVGTRLCELSSLQFTWRLRKVLNLLEI